MSTDKNLEKIYNKLLEATISGVSSGRYTIPLSPGTRIFDKKTLSPFVIDVSKYDDAQLEYDSYDGTLDVSKETAKKMEKKSRKISQYIKKHPSGSDDDGDILNQGVGNLKETLRDTIKRIIRESLDKK